MAQHHIKGFSLIEVLVALLVLSLGLLGLAALQATSLSFNTDAYTRTQATVFAYDILDKMRANATGVSNGNYDVTSDAAAATKISTYNGCKASGSTCNCSGTSTCTTANLALYDLGTWYERMALALPGSSSPGRRATIDRDANNLVTVRIYWLERDVQKNQEWSIQLCRTNCT